MTVGDYESELRRITRTLAAVAHTLESKNDSDNRIRRVLRLAEQCVPYSRCALLTAVPGRKRDLFSVPEPTAEAAELLRDSLARILLLMTDAEEIGRSSGPVPHLALPVVGLDRIIGVLLLEPSADMRYEAKHVRLLSVVAAQLAAYLTTLQLLEDEAARSRALASANELQQVVSGIVSHDLRTPVSVVTMAASLLLKKPRSQREVRALERILSSMRLAERIINDLTDATRARTSGGIPIFPQSTELVSLTQDVVESARLAHPGREISLAAPVAIRGKWDPQRLSQVILNLLNNAFIHGRPDAPVQVRVEQAEGKVELSVHNEGPPIPPRLASVIFDPFRQGPQSHSRGAGGGLGLGLYIVSQVVRAHGGDVTVRSSAAEGTTFTVRLPPVSIHTGKSSSNGSGSPRDVLIVEDAREARELLAEVLSGKGYHVTQAENGLEGLQKLRELGRPCIVLLDLEMPVMDGWEFQQRLRADPRLNGTPVIVISGAGVHPPLPEQVEAFLTKPVDLPELERALSGIETPAFQSEVGPPDSV